MTSLLNIAGNVPTDAFAEGSSLRFEDGDSAYLSFTPASAGNRKTWTWSGWVKRGNIGTSSTLFSTGSGTAGTNTNNTFLQFLSDNRLRFLERVGGSNVDDLITTAVFRDVSAWYNIVLTRNSTEATASDRIKIFVNGTQITTFDTSDYPALNADGQINNTNSHAIGERETWNSDYYDGYLANVAFIDGQALDPTSFGEYQDTLWKPKSDTAIQALTFGTNGFYLPMKQTTEAEGFSTVTWSGNDVDGHGIEGVGFSPDFVWIKNRDVAENHNLYDTIRGAGQQLYSDTTDAEFNRGTLALQSFDSDGFSLGIGGEANDAGENYVAWCWDAGTGSAVSNTDGSISSSVKANTAKGFSIATYTGNGVNGASVGHGLNQAPEMVIIKSRSLSPSNWPVYHSGVGNTGALNLDTTNATSTSVLWWNNTSPSASVVTLGTIAASNTNGATQVMYAFHSVSGYSSIGSYSGTGASGNSITGLGFKPAFVMIKRTDASGDSWVIHDNTRTPSGTVDEILLANSSSAELTNASYAVDFDADGFTLQTTNVGWNASGGTYIYMAFADTRDATFFGDTSGNSNNWTPNALNNTDVVPDSPVTNFAVLNPLTLFTSNTSLAEGNLKANATASGSGSNWGTVFSSITLPTTGKYYVEGRAFINVGSGNNSGIGVLDTSTFAPAHNRIYYNFTTGEGYDGIYLSLFNNNAQPVSDGVLGTAVGSITGTSALVMLAVDVDNGKVWAGYDGTWINSGDPAAGTGEIATRTFSSTDAIAVGTSYNSSNAQGMFANFGQDSSFAGNETPQGNTDDNGQGDFYYAPPSGFLALNRNNLPTPDITAPDEYFNTLLYTGTGSSLSVTGANFQPDWTWIKRRNGSTDHALHDSVRGANEKLESNNTDSEVTNTNFSSFDADGFTVISGSAYNASGNTYVAWNWKAGGTAVSNTDGSITSQVSANQDAGFSVVSHTGNGSNATIGHGLGVAPSMIIHKRRDSTADWNVYHASLGKDTNIILNTTAASYASTTWNNTAPTSSVYSIVAGANTNTATYIAYCFAEVEGYSKIGSYTGNGSTDGTFVHCGFRPAWVMVRRTDAANNWIIQNNKTPGYNKNSELYANLSNAETTASDRADFLSNGFKARINSTTNNGSGANYIFIAFAEAPFKNANAR